MKTHLAAHFIHNQLATLTVRYNGGIRHATDSENSLNKFELTRRSIQSQADSGLPAQLILVAFRRVNHTFLYLYPRDT
jgi:hypothetical protein